MMDGFVNLKVKKGFGRRREDIGDPFPNFTVREYELPSVCKCVFDGDKFYVDNERDMHTLHRNGSFGVSNLTHRGPSLGNSSFLRRPYYLKQLERIGSTNGTSKDFSSKSSSSYSNSTFTSNKRVKTESTGVVSSSARHSNGASSHIRGNESSNEFKMESFDSKPCIGSQKCQKTRTHLVIDTSCTSSGPVETLNQEKLLLMPEEAIFLSFGVGCLIITSIGGETLSYRAVWKILVELDPEFPILYAVYHYFRSKNWVPKLGDSYGASYVLYHVGPSVYHSTYIVHILGFPSKPSPTWTEVAAWLRLAGHVSKNVLLCEVSLPLAFDAVRSEPRSIFDMSLKETILFRWIPNSSANHSESSFKQTS